MQNYNDVEESNSSNLISWQEVLIERRSLRAILCNNQTKWEMKNFDPLLICMQVDIHGGCSKVAIIEVIT